MPERLIVAACGATVAGTVWEQEVEHDEIIAGRDPEADLVLDDLSVSLQHFKLSREEDGWELRDLNSCHGTRLNGRRIEPGGSVPLRPGDTIEAGVFRIGFEDKESMRTGTIARAIRYVLSGPGEVHHESPCLLVVNGPDAGTRCRLSPGKELQVGRAASCDLVLNDARVSRKHGTVAFRKGKAWYRDCSLNGTRVNGELVGKPVRLEHGMQLQAGSIQVIFEHPGHSRIDWEALLRRSSGRPGRILAPALGLLAGSIGLAVALL
jgi:pSer/pThr/pTyr-binding forkhead associated (FHA) protein